ncbi:hypothetical protein [Desertivirga xinjiangensis]|nr:hypothetical protein [Pedobacter xinjiangensis]
MFKKLSLAVLISAFFFASCKKEPFNGSSSTGDFSRSASADVDID